MFTRNLGAATTMLWGLLVPPAGAAELLRLDFAWPNAPACGGVSHPSPAYTLSGVPAAARRLHFTLSMEGSPREMGGGEIAYSAGMPLRSGLFYYRGPCAPGNYRWTVRAEDGSGRDLATAFKVRPFP